MALELGVVGLPGSFELYVRELDLLYNIPAADTTKMSWADVSHVSTTQLVNLPKTLDFKVSGSLDLNISGFVLAAGAFEITQETGLSIDDGVNAVITNASLLSRQDVRDELALADWVSLKVDAVREEV